ncbi:MAG: hypothetical protein KJZ47_05005 [Gemmatimonadales bacterium]|nr:hypothetical protein [Gemmatimonadales bacterium]
MRPAARHALATLVVLAVSCGDPVGPCGCSPPVPWAVVRGEVRDAAARPTGSALVRIESVATPNCRGTTIVGEARSSGDGRFQLLVDRFCESPFNVEYDAWAEPPAGTPWRASERVRIRVNLRTGTTQDTATVALLLRDP